MTSFARRRRQAWIALASAGRSECLLLSISLYSSTRRQLPPFRKSSIPQPPCVGLQGRVWWHAAVRFEHARQAARGLGTDTADASRAYDAVRTLDRAKWCLWHGRW